MAAKLDYRWHLRQVMATRDMFQTTDLIAPLADRGIELSSSQVYRLVTERPERLSLKILMALLDILDCSMEELIEPVADASAASRKAGRGRFCRGPRHAASQTSAHRPARAMTGTVDDEAVTDPVGLVVRLVSAVESSLGTEQIRDVVSRTAGGRAKRRRLARTLAQDPAVLTTGGPPVSWAVGQLLFGLRSAGATSIAAPRCAHCGCTVSYMISQGNLVCSPCRDKPQTCANCGEQRRVSTRDRHSRPRCEQCPDIDDPMPLLERIVTGIDPQLSSQTIRQAVMKSTVRPAGQRRLAWAVVDNPELLTGAGCDAPAPAVLRFINQLSAAGSATVVPPTCARCGRAVSLSKLLDGKRVCRTCFAHHAAVPCAGCGAVRDRQPGTRRAVRSVRTA